MIYRILTSSADGDIPLANVSFVESSFEITKTHDRAPDDLLDDINQILRRTNQLKSMNAAEAPDDADYVVRESHVDLTEEAGVEFLETRLNNAGYSMKEYEAAKAVPEMTPNDFPLPGMNYEAPIDAKHKANQLGLDAAYHVRKIGGHTRYVPGEDLQQLESAIDEEPKTNLESSKYAEYDAGKKVKVDGQRGVILELHTDEFSLAGETFEATQDEPLYVVGTEEGSLVVNKSEIVDEQWPPTEEGDPEKVTEAEPKANYTKENTNPFADYEPQLTRGNAIQGRIEPEDPGIGFDSWPDSWEESEKPARLIALDAWSSFTPPASWTGCFNEIGNKRICSAWKDEMMQTTGWR